MLEYWNAGMLETNATLKFTFSALGIALISQCIFSRVRNVLLAFHHYSYLPLFPYSAG